MEFSIVNILRWSRVEDADDLRHAGDART